MTGTMLTASGRLVRPLCADPATLVLEDVAHALSNIGRFGGHARRFYSVAEHTVLGLQFVPDEHKLRWMLHDAAEAYLGDVVRPLKGESAFSLYRVAERELASKLRMKFLPDASFRNAAQGHTLLHEVDARMLATELRDLMPACREVTLPAEPYPILIAPVSHEDWASRFLVEWYFWRAEAEAGTASAADCTADGASGVPAMQAEGLGAA